MSDISGNPPPRWRGLESFSEGDHQRFYGRSLEIADLTRRVSQRRLTILFGQSGLGKTSLLRAGLFPELRKLRLLPVYLRIDHHTAVADPVSQIRAALGAAIGTKLPDTAELSSWCHDLRHGLGGGPLCGIVPVLVFDQFEEVFTLGQASPEATERSTEFLRQLADLAEARPSKTLELAFEDQLADPLDYDFETSPYRLVIAIREDYLSQLERCRQSMPSLMENRLPLDRLRGDQAMEAVLGPGEGIITREVAEAVVRFVAGTDSPALSGIHVEPPLLSLVCQQLDHSRGDKPITAELLGGKREEILGNYYQDCFTGLDRSVREAIEDLLVTESGFRENIASETLERMIGAEALRKLEARRLIHSEARDGRQRVELTHDVLTKLVVASRSSRREQQQRENLHARSQEKLRRRFRTIATTGLAVGLVALSALSLLALNRKREADQQKLVAQQNAQAAILLREEAEAAANAEAQLRAEISESADALAATARNLTAVLLGSEKGTVALTTETLVHLLPRMEALQTGAMEAAQAAGTGLSEAHLDLFNLHRLAAEAYGRNESLEPAMAQIEKARALVGSIPDGKLPFATPDLDILESEIRLGVIVIENGTLNEATYQDIANPLRRALAALDGREDTDPLALSSRWRWLKASNLLARLDRHQKNIDASRARYEANLAKCGDPFAKNINIRRMKSEALNGLANLKVYRIDHRTADPGLASRVGEAVEEYRQARTLREAVLAESPTDAWIKHELAQTLENLASADMILASIQQRQTGTADPALVREAIELRKQRLSIHKALHEADPGNRLFAIAHAYGIANLVRQEALAFDTPPDNPDPQRWFAELSTASVMAPDELKIAETRLEVLIRYHGSAAETNSVREDIRRLTNRKR